jgi:transcriptional regulator with XRE-family HTH domain
MPYKSESPPTPRQEFCLALKGIRERKGITLDQVAAATKVPADLFAAFERGDLRRWPNGLFRRAFLRGYAVAIGVPVDETCDAFARLFAEKEAPPTVTVSSSVESTEEETARLALDSTWHGPRTAVLIRLLAAMIDAAFVVGAAIAVARIAHVDSFASIAVMALIYYSLATALLDASPAQWVIARRKEIFAVLCAKPEPPASESPNEPEPREWITDAHRVGPQGQFRVRIKVPQ